MIWKNKKKMRMACRMGRRLLGFLVACSVTFGVMPSTYASSMAIALNVSEPNGQAVQISGKVMLKMSQRGVSNQRVSLFITKPFQDDFNVNNENALSIIANIGQAKSETISGTDGIFSFQYSIPVGDPSGEYKVYVNTPGTETAVAGKFHYVNPSDSAQILPMLNSMTMSTDFTQQFGTIKDKISLNYGAYTALLVSNPSAVNSINQKLIAQKYNDVAAFRVLFNNLLALERINHATVQEMHSVLVEQSEYLGLNDLMYVYQKLYTLNTGYVETVHMALVGKNFKEAQTVHDTFYEVIQKQLQEVFPLTNAPMAVGNGAANVGQSVTLSIKINPLVENVRGLKMVMNYNAQALAVLSKDGIHIDGGLNNYNLKNIDISQSGIATFDVVFNDNENHTLGSICSIDFGIRLEAAAGETVVDTNGSVVQYFDEENQVVRGVKAATSSGGKISITKKETRADSGGGGGGGAVSPSVTLTPMPTVVPTVVPSPTPVAPKPVTFNDIPDNHWAKDSISVLAARGIINGFGDTFKPEENVTREQLIKLLVLTFDLKEESANTQFTDVSKDAWYYSYLLRAEKAGITNGMGNGSFGIGQEVSREDMVVMVVRAASKMNVKISPRNTDTFIDNDQIASYARSSAQTMLQAGIMKGLEDGSFAPKMKTNRAMAAKVIYEVLKLAQ